VRHRLHGLYVHSLLRSQALKEEVVMVARELERRGLHPILLKGAHLAFAVYADPALRPMNDIDLLLPPGEMEAATGALGELGYGVHPAVGADVDYSTLHHSRPVRRPSSAQIELHHRLDFPTSPFRIDHDGLRARARFDERVPFGAAVLAPEDLLLHLCTHIAYNHAFDVRLLALQDVRQVARWYRDRLDWAVVRARAEADGRAAFVQVALAVTERLWPGSLLPGLLDAWDLKPREAAIVSTAVDYALQLPVELPATVQRLHETPGLLGRVATMRAALFPSASALRRMYDIADHRSVWWGYLWRPLDLLWRRGKSVAGLAASGSSAREALARDRRRVLIEAWKNQVAVGS
jgi:hypothetical protein